ncbi:MAG: outer membrane beta-barrel protein [Bacteroidales bacterium]|nr:outer membrane beta-barrel protein [Bacteroidales bacterium]
MSLSELGIDTNSFDFSVPVGLSYEYKNFVLDGRYNIGVTKIVDGDDSKNRVFQITLGYKFKL